MTLILWQRSSYLTSSCCVDLKQKGCQLFLHPKMGLLEINKKKCFSGLQPWHATCKCPHRRGRRNVLNGWEKEVARVMVNKELIESPNYSGFSLSEL